MARLASAAVEDKLEAVIRCVEQEAADPLVSRLMEKLRTAAGPEFRAQIHNQLQKHLEILLLRYETQYSWVITDSQAVALARAPFDIQVVGKKFRYREWFNGLRELPADTGEPLPPRTSTGISPAYRSTSQGRPIMLTIATPVRAMTAPPPGQSSEILGVMGTTLRLETFHDWLAVAENRSEGSGCPDSFVLLMYHDQLLRHPCPSADAPALPVGATGFLDQPSLKKLMASASKSSTEFYDPLRRGPDGLPIVSLAVARSPQALAQWTIILVQDIDTALRPMAALSRDFRRPAKIALGVGGAALIVLVGLLWWGERKKAVHSKP